MNISRRAALISALSTTACGSLGIRFAGAQQLRRIRFAVALKSLTAAFANVFIGERLGYAKRRGITNEVLAANIRISGLGQLASMIHESDRMVTFGD